MSANQEDKPTVSVWNDSVAELVLEAFRSVREQLRERLAYLFQGWLA